MKTYSLVVLSLAGIWANRLDAQTATFQKTFGGYNYDAAFCIAATPDGGFIMSGQTKSLGDTLGDSYLIKVDSLGDKQWERYEGGRWLDGGNSVVPTQDGGYFITNHTESYGSGECDSWIYKTGDIGDVTWEQVYGSSRDDAGYEGIQTSNGEYVVTGLTIVKPDTMGNAFIAKYRADGEPLWVQTYGGENTDMGVRIVESHDHGYVIAGSTTSNSNGPEDMFVFKTDANGKLIWSKNIGGPGYEESYGLTATHDGGYLVAGFTTSFGNSEDCYLVKLDGAGNFLWGTVYGGDRGDRIASVIETEEGNIVFTGYTQSFGDTAADVLVIKTDALGNQLWMKTFGGDKQDIGSWLVASKDGGYAIAGMTKSSGNGDADVYFIKTNSEGEITLGINAVSNNPGFQVTPNPAHGAISFNQTGTPANVSLTLYDVAGNVLDKKENLSAGQTNIAINNLVSGLYFYSVTDNKEKILSRGKLVVN